MARNEDDITWKVMVEVDGSGEPVERAEYWLKQKGSPECDRKDAVGFLDGLPSELVQAKIWPLLMDEPLPIYNFMMCSVIRGVCKAWLRHVDATPDWLNGMIAWNDTRYVPEWESSESDEEWVAANRPRRHWIHRHV